jgi:hypothetical protein
VTLSTGGKVAWDRDMLTTTTNPHLSMVNLWMQLGFVVFDADAGKLVEKERTLGVGVA